MVATFWAAALGQLGATVLAEHEGNEFCLFTEPPPTAS